METKTIQPQVIIIPPDPNARQRRADPYHQKRVAAYCRVSTNEEDQVESYDAQRRFYTDKIASNKDWKMVDIFADKGITGTSTKKRADFNRMIKACEKGKVDMILTKSISRFARNTVDSLRYVRKLKALGISVVFEKENIDTSTMTDEMILTVMSMFAQAESESISKSVSGGQRYRYREGKVKYCYPIYGYVKGEDSKPVIFEEQAVHVREIYRMFLEGNSVLQIRDHLNATGVLTVKGLPNWSSAIIQGILKNEKYCGDAILQKTYVEDVISKKVRPNNGLLPKYYIKDCHPAIVDRATYEAVQEELARRSSKKKVTIEDTFQKSKFSGKYALTDLMVCDECGSNYKRTTWCRKSGKQIVWRCVNRLEHGSRYCKDAPTVPEPLLHAAIIRVINRTLGDTSGIMPLLKKNLTLSLGGSNAAAEVCSLEARVHELKDMMRQLVELAVKSGGDESRYEREFEKLGAEINAMNEMLASKKRLQEIESGQYERVDDVYAKISADGFKLTEFDNTVVRKLLECVKVTKDRTIKVYFVGGYMVEEPLEP